MTNYVPQTRISGIRWSVLWHPMVFCSTHIFIHAIDTWLLHTGSLTHWGRDKWPPFTDDIFKCIFLNENVLISIKISLKFVPKGQINNIPALVQIMAWRRPGDKPLYEPMMVCLVTHICVTKPQWVKWWMVICVVFYHPACGLNMSDYLHPGADRSGPSISHYAAKWVFVRL